MRDDDRWRDEARQWRSLAEGVGRDAARLRTALKWAVAALETFDSDVLPCPGNHRTDGKPCGDDDDPGDAWVFAGECPETLTFDVESEDVDGYPVAHYLVADGPCVEALGLGDDDYSHAIWGEYSKVRRLRKQFLPVLTAARAALGTGSAETATTAQEVK